MKRDIASDTTYNAGLPDYTDEKLREIYANAGVDFETGLPVASEKSKSAGGKVALASGKLSAGVLSIDAPVWAIFQAARKCQCISCAGALENIKSSAAWNKSNIALRRPTNHSMSNIRYFIQRLTDIVFSPVIKHNL